MILKYRIKIKNTKLWKGVYIENNWSRLRVKYQINESDYPQGLIILSPCTMAILKWPVILFRLFKFEFCIYILNKNVEFKFWTWI